MDELMNWTRSRMVTDCAEASVAVHRKMQICSALSVDFLKSIETSLDAANTSVCATYFSGRMRGCHPGGKRIRRHRAGGDSLPRRIRRLIPEGIRFVFSIPPCVF